MKKLRVKCSSLFVLCRKRVCIEKGYLRWSGHWLVIWHTLVKINKLPTLVGTKMYTHLQYLTCVMLTYHFTLSIIVNLLTPCHMSKTCQLSIFFNSICEQSFKNDNLSLSLPTNVNWPLSGLISVTHLTHPNVTRVWNMCSIYPSHDGFLVSFKLVLYIYKE